jgi:hypothetical protein
MQDSQKRGSEGESCCVSKRLKTTIMEDKIQVDEKIAQVASVMKKLASENAILRNRLHKMEKLAAENAKDINYKLDIILASVEKIWSGVEKLQRDTKTLISHAEKTSAGVKQIVSGRM